MRLTIAAGFTFVLIILTATMGMHSYLDEHKETAKTLGEDLNMDRNYENEGINITNATFIKGRNDLVVDVHNNGTTSYNYHTVIHVLDNRTGNSTEVEVSPNGDPDYNLRDPPIVHPNETVRATVPFDNNWDPTTLKVVTDLGSVDVFEPVNVVEMDVIVETHAATGIGQRSATLNGEVTKMQGVLSLDVYFEWGEEGQGLPQSTLPQTITAPQTFSEDVNQLNRGTTYEFRAVAEDTLGNKYTGQVRTFTTDCPPGQGC